jgi:hypothetical protein
MVTGNTYRHPAVLDQDGDDGGYHERGLMHKGLEVDCRPARFADVQTIERISGQHLAPIIVDG